MNSIGGASPARSLMSMVANRSRRASMAARYWSGRLGDGSGRPLATPPRMIVPAPAAAASLIACSCSRSTAEYGIWKASNTPMAMWSGRFGSVPDMPRKRILPSSRSAFELGDGVVVLEQSRGTG